MEINPGAAELGRVNAILWGRGQRRYHVRDFPGPVSVKWVVRGEAEWKTGRRRFLVDESSYLILNAGQSYSITVDARDPVETFCVFFANGFVEDALRTRREPARRLLDEPFCAAGETCFFERLRPARRPVIARMRKLHAALKRDEDAAEDVFFELADALLEDRDELQREMGRVPALRAGTREELLDTEIGDWPGQRQHHSRYRVGPPEA